MKSPLYDHDLDAHPPAVAASPGRNGGSLKDGGGKAGPSGGGEGRGSLFMARVLLGACGLALLLIPVAVSEFGARLVGPPFLGLIWLLGISGLGAWYAWRVRGRLRRSGAHARDKGVVGPTPMLAALGLIGGGMPAPLRAVVVVGLLAGIVSTLTYTMSLDEELGARPDGDGNRVVLFGDGMVRGSIESVDSNGPFRFGQEGSSDGSFTTGGTMRQSPARRGWVHIMRQGSVRGEDLSAEMRGQGIALQGGEAIRGWCLVQAASLLTAWLLLIACVAAALGRRIGRVLLLIWAAVYISAGLLIRALVPDMAGIEETLTFLYPVALLMVLHTPAARAYFGRSSGGLSDASPLKGPKPKVALA